MRRPILPPDPAPPRLTPRPLPEGRYVPGVGRHPLRDADGRLAPPARPDDGVDPVAWGLDLLGQRYFWEAHEALEGAWRDYPRGTPERELLQGLVQLAAACLKRHGGHAASCDRLLDAARARLVAARTAGGEVVLGVATGEGIAAVDALRRGDAWPVLMPAREAGVAIRVVAAAVIRDGRVLAARRRPALARGGLWELPGGKVEAGEDDRDALRRELAEELRLDAVVGDLLAEAVHDYGDVRIRLVAYAVHAPDGEPALDDHDAVAWLAADELGRVDWAPADVPLLPAVRARLDGVRR